MALAQLLNRAPNSPDTCFRMIRDFLAAQNGIENFGPSGDSPGPGYEIVDASYASGNPADTAAGDWCVLKSNGEGGGSFPLYIRLNFGVTQHGINPFLGWNTDTHTGVMGTARTTNIYHNGAGEMHLWIYADLDEIHIVIRPRASTTYYWHPCGRIKSTHTFYDGTPARIQEAVAAGQDVTITPPIWPSWVAPGKKVYNWDEKAIQELEITAVNETAGTFTVASSRAMDAGSWMAEDLAIFACSSHNSKFGDNSAMLWFLPGRVPVSGTSVQGSPVAPAIAGMDGKYGVRYTCDIWVQRTAEIRGRLANTRLTRPSASVQGEAWIDDEGVSWRLHTVYDGAVMAFREAL